MLTVLLGLAVFIILVLSVIAYQKSTNAICLSKKRLEGKTVIVTGGTMGMGLVIATDLADRGARVIIACPFEDEGISVQKRIIQETENENVIFKLLDLSSLKSTRQFAKDVLDSEDRLDILINNAGVGAPAKKVTPDGMNFVLQVNYYGMFLLTLLLLPLLRKTGTSNDPSRILTTASVLHMIGEVNTDITKIFPNETWHLIKIYANSKMAVVFFTHELAKRLKGTNVVVNTVDPGAVGTTIFYSINNFVGFVLGFVIAKLFKTPWFGAQTALHVALDKKAGKVSGVYFKNCAMNRAVERAYSDETGKVLWEESLRLVKMSVDELDQCLRQ